MKAVSRYYLPPSDGFRTAKITAFVGIMDGDKPPFFFDSQKVCKICSAFSALEGQAGEYCRFVPAKKVCKITERIKVSEQRKSNCRLIGH